MWLWMTMAFCLKNLKFLLHRKPLMFLWMVTAAQVWVLLHFSSSCWYRSSLRNTYHRHTHTHILKHADTRSQNQCHKLGMEAPWWVPAGTVPPRYRTCPAEPPSALCLMPQGGAGSAAPRIWNTTLSLTLCLSKFVLISGDEWIYLDENNPVYLGCFWEWVIWGKKKYIYIYIFMVINLITVTILHYLNEYMYMKHIKEISK